MLKNKNFAYLNFDDGQLLSAWDENAVWQALQQVYPAFDYLLLDEVQNLDGWIYGCQSYIAMASTWL